MKRSGITWLAWGLAAAAALGGATVLYYYPPESASFYPRCWLHAMTGWNCPGCGALRAAHQMLHGHFRSAFSLNPLLFVLLPAMAWSGWACGVRRLTGREPWHPFKYSVSVWVLVGGMVAFGIARNLPLALFAVVILKGTGLGQ